MTHPHAGAEAMEVWVVLNNEGDWPHVLAAYKSKEQAQVRARRETSGQSYYEYRVQPVRVYPKSKRPR